MKRYDIKPGDWVRFSKNGTLEISVVQYVDKNPCLGNRKFVMTAQGIVDFNSVLEVRREQLMTDDEEV